MKDDYNQQISESANEIALRDATTSKRRGKGRARDLIVLTKMIWGEAQSYIGPLQTIVLFAALLLPAVITVNNGLVMFFSWFGMDPLFLLPVNLIAFIAFIFIIAILVFGYISVRYAGTYKTTNEWSARMNPGFRTLWKQNQEILKRLDSLEKENK